MKISTIFIVLLPALAALGHDAYLYYMNQDSAIYAEGELHRFFASLGYIWTTYHPSSYQEVVRSVSKETWSVINMVLTQKAFFVGLVFAAVIYVLSFLSWFFGKERKTLNEARRREASGERSREDLFK